MARFYRAADGTMPVDQFIDAINDVSHQFAIDAKIELMNQLDEERPHLAFPHSSQIEGELRELRCQKGKTRYRILYRRSGHFVILLHIFAKNTKAVPEPDKAIARTRWDDFRVRMDAAPREFPSPIGKRAPAASRANASEHTPSR